jgi:hypothetical protein
MVFELLWQHATSGCVFAGEAFDSDKHRDPKHSLFELARRLLPRVVPVPQIIPFGTIMLVSQLRLTSCAYKVLLSSWGRL